MSLPLYLSAALLPVTLLQTAAGQVQDLGTVPGSGPSALSAATGISLDGRVVVGANTGPASPPSAFAWSETEGFMDLADPMPPLDAYSLSEIMVSGDGSIAVATALKGQLPFALRWDLATGAVLPLSAFAYVGAVSDDGSSFAGVSPLFPGARAARWSETGGFQQLGGPITTASSATDMSGDGTVIVGTMRPSGGPTVPFRWTQGTGMMPLTGFTGECRPFISLSSDGEVIAGVRVQAGMPPRAFRWTAVAGISDLGSIAGGTTDSSRPLLINDNGSVIAGTESSPSAQTQDGWRWTQATGMTRLSPIPNLRPTALSSDGSVMSCVERLDQGSRPRRWTLSGGAIELASLDASVPIIRGSTGAISADGTVIVGQSLVDQDQPHGALWREDESLGRSVCAPGAPNSTGAAAVLRLGGTNRVASGALSIEASYLPPGSFGFVICSRAEGFVANPGGSQGNLCLTGSIGRYVAPGQTQTANAAGEFSLAINPTTLVQPNGPVSPGYGESWFFQAWYRDSNPASTSNFTDAATVRLY